MRGMTLVEAILALGIGGIVLTQSIDGVTRYASGLKVQATASKLTMLNRAADRFAEDNFESLMAAAPEELGIAVLEPYFGNDIGPDAFGNTYKLTTRQYNITVPDPVNGGTKTEKGLQVLVVGQMPSGGSAMADDRNLRAEVANAAGAASGFISDSYLSCRTSSGAQRPAGSICGAYGSYSFSANNFSATTFSDAALVSLVTKGDSSVYGDQLYRYDYGDPELNTMHTDLYMSDNVIHDPDEILGVDHILFNANDSVLESEAGARLAVRSGEDLRLQARGGAIELNSNTNDYNFRANPSANPTNCWGVPCTNDMVKLGATNSRMRITNTETVFGDKQWFEHGTTGLRTGTGNIWAGQARIDSVQANGVNSLFNRNTDALRLQNNRDNGEVIIGRRVRYTPDGNADAGIYELSDGELTAQHVQVQDITCADCGGSLSQILPKWRHMGTYFIPDGQTRMVPKPTCSQNRTSTKNRAAIGENLAYTEPSNTDNRYQAKIILIPRQLGFRNPNHKMNYDFRFDAQDVGTGWLARANAGNGLASALAKTYCVFVGGDVDPASTATTVLPNSGNANWQYLE